MFSSKKKVEKTAHVEIVQKDTQAGEVLRKVAPNVTDAEFGGAELQSILSDMRVALASQADGVALAAPQIGVSKRIFIVAPFLFKKNPEAMQLIFINPEIIWRSNDNKKMDEGCLSVRPWYGKTRRSSKATVKAQDEHGNEFEMDGTGLIAQIFQHEIDHLDGILFSDHATDLIELEE